MITAIAENLRDQGVSFPFWMRDYKIEPFPTPPTTKAITVSDSTNTAIRTIYGGVNLSVPKKAITVNKSIPLAKNMAGEISVNLHTKPMLQPVAIAVNDKVQTKKFAAVSLPGSNTKALAPCHLSETDLIVPVKNGYFISLDRNFNSFFSPTGIFGDLWSMDLPFLEKQKIPNYKSGD
ncbi:MAG TPA: hypothetical protein VK957_13850 [Lunatimonas sp.]|nr:hypothetical protein [Lunatimonas sp.]